MHIGALSVAMELCHEDTFARSKGPTGSKEQHNIICIGIPIAHYKTSKAYSLDDAVKLVMHLCPLRRNKNHKNGTCRKRKINKISLIIQCLRVNPVYKVNISTSNPTVTSHSIINLRHQSHCLCYSLISHIFVSLKPIIINLFETSA